MKLSIPMMVKNESKNLEAVLESLQPILKGVETELIIVDTGSSDNTVEIARKYTDHVFFHEWNNNFSEMRNITISYATGDWLLFVDGDEVIENPESVVTFLKSEIEKQVNTGLVKIVNILSEENSADVSSNYTARLFRNRPDFGFEGAVHNQPKHLPPHFELETIFTHYGYMSTDEELMERKFERTSKILIDELKKNPKDIYYLYQLSISYSMHKDVEKAMKYIKEAMKIVKEQNKRPEDHMYVYLELIKMLTENNHFGEAEGICLEIEDIGEKYLDLYYYLARIKYMLGKKKEAIVACNKYIEVRKNINIIKSDYTVKTQTEASIESIYYELVLIYCSEGNDNKAYSYYIKIQDMVLIQAMYREVTDLLLRLEKYNELKEFYDRIIEFSDQLGIRSVEQYMEESFTKIDASVCGEIRTVLSQGNTDYAVLNRVNNILCGVRSDVNVDGMVEIIQKLDFLELPSCYGMILFYCIKEKFDLSKIIPNVNLPKIRYFLEYIIENEKNNVDVIVDYISGLESMDLVASRINKELCKYSSMQDSIDDLRFEFLFNRYVAYGIFYITQLYNPQIIEQELIVDIKEKEEVFLLYIYKSQQLIESNPLEAVKFLKKAMVEYPFARGVEVLKKQIEDQVSFENIANKENINEELDEIQVLKKNFRANIEVLIGKKKFEEANQLIEQYETIELNDPKIMALKKVLSEQKNH